MTADKLREMLSYNPESGTFTWLTQPGRRTDLVGSVAGSKKPRSDRRLTIMVDGANRFAHRLAFLYMTGRWPTGEIDHIDGNPSNNCWANLREVSRETNAQNQRKAQKRSKTGLLGVHPKRDKFCAQICAGGRRITLGVFTTAEEAYAVYLDAKRALHQGCTI